MNISSLKKFKDPKFLKKVFVNKYAILIYACILFVMYFLLTCLHITNATIMINNEQKRLYIPFEAHIGQNQSFTITGNFHASGITPTKFHITVDDAIHQLVINDTNVPLQIIKGSLGDITNGFVMELKDYIKPGKNTFMLELRNNGGPAALRMAYYWKTPYVLIPLALFLLTLYTLIFLLLRKIKLNTIVIILFLLGITIRLWYFTYTDYNARTHDVWGHFDYVKYLINEKKVPNKDSCWQCYNPPLYYIPLALEQVALMRMGFSVHLIKRSFQIISIAYMMIFLLFSVLISRFFIKGKPARIFTAALIFLWPGTIMHSVRVGNDLLVYLTHAVSFYYICRWYFEGRKKDSIISVIFACLCLFTKTTGLLMMGIIGILLFVKFLQSTEKKVFIKGNLIALLILVLFPIILKGGPILKDRLTGKQYDWILPNSAVVAKDGGNMPENYLWFDVQTFIRHGFTSVYDYNKGREFFFNFFFKTSLFTENTFGNKYHESMAQVISSMFLVLLLIFFTSLIFIRPPELLKLLPLFLNLSILVASLLVLRIRHPAPCHSDFRFVAPVLTSFALLIGIIIEKMREYKFVIPEYFSYIITGGFAACCFIMFLQPV